MKNVLVCVVLACVVFVNCYFSSADSIICQKLSLCVSVCLCANQSGTNHNCLVWSLVILRAHSYWEHITPVLRQLHWLSVRRQVDFKISTLVYRSLAGTTPVHLADECTLVTAAGRRPLRSADNRTCLVKRSRNQFGDRCFATAGPMLWNSLSEQLWQPDITLQTVQTIVANVYVWFVGLRHPVSEH